MKKTVSLICAFIFCMMFAEYGAAEDKAAVLIAQKSSGGYSKSPDEPRKAPSWAVGRPERPGGVHGRPPGHGRPDPGYDRPGSGKPGHGFNRPGQGRPGQPGNGKKYITPQDMIDRAKPLPRPGYGGSPYNVPDRPRRYHGNGGVNIHVFPQYDYYWSGDYDYSAEESYKEQKAKEPETSFSSGGGAFERFDDPRFPKERGAVKTYTNQPKNDSVTRQDEAMDYYKQMMRAWE